MTARAPRAGGPVGVVDIGSNSIRLVVFDAARRAPQPVFNEKILCGLGRGLQRTGELDPAGVALALENLQRFAGLAMAMGVEDLSFIATAAVRDARNGAEFVRAAEQRIGRGIQILSGAEEARLSAMGVAARVARGALTLSVGWFTTEEEIQFAAGRLLDAWERLRG